MEYNESISIKKEEHTYINDVKAKQIIIEGLGNKNIINTCILSIQDDKATIQTGKKIETIAINDLPTVIRIMAELLVSDGPKEEKKTTKKNTKKNTKKTKKTTKKETKKQTKGDKKDD